MAYRKPQRYFSFADLAVEKHVDKNRSLSVLKQLDKTIDWKPIDKLLAKFYHTGKSAEGGKAYPPLLLFKCLLLQKWFQIGSDPELESQINDRISFKSFLGLPIDQPAPDHSTFSRFRSRLSSKAMTQINSALLNQFHQHGISINKGVAVDARLIKSASKPVSGQKLSQLRDQQDVLDKNGKPKKFSRDLESDWTVKNDAPHFGIKEQLPWMSKTGLCCPPKSLRLPIVIQRICPMLPSTACIPMKNLTPCMPIRDMQALRIVSFWPLIRSVMASCAKTISMPC
jgi:IS5 family transposase